MKKVLPASNEVFLYERQGKLQPWFFFAEDIVEAVNKGRESEQIGHLVYQKLYEWMSRYIEEGITEEFLNELNAAMREIRYSKYIVPLDLIPSESGFPQSAYVAEYDPMPTPEAYAANDFSKLLTSGHLKRLKHCQMDECANLFLGPPQAKWCSKSCGSKFRVRRKRKRDSF